MAFTPYSTPIQYEYKPLNLAAFAVPLGKMQEQLDLTKATISTTDFDLAHLPYGSDPERAKELIATARAKRDELAKNLMETKNYRQAAIKLHELNKTWKLDPERSALESNYKLWQERDKAERERIDNGKDNQITRDQYLQWRNDEIRKYESGNTEGKTGAGFKASYEKPEGDYKIITGQTGRLSDLEEELDSKVLEVASKVNSDSFESALRAVGIDEDTQHKLFKKYTTEELTKEKVANAVRGYLLQQPRFRDWGTEVAKYDFKDMLYSNKYSEYALSIIQNSLSDVDAKIAAREKRLKEVQVNKNEDPIYQRLLEEKSELVNASAGGEYDPKIVEREYIDQHLNRMYDMSAVGKVMEFKKVSTEDVARAIPKADDGSGSGSTLTGAGDVLVTPNKFETFSVNTINSTIYKNAKEMLPQLAKIGNLAGGAARTIFLGQKGSETRTKNSNNPGLYRDRIERGLSIFTDLKNQGVTNSTEFYKALNRAGILATQTDAKKLWNDWSAPNSGSLTTTKKILEQTAQSALDYQDAKNLHNNILDSLKESPDVKKIVGENANSYFSITGSLTADQIKKIEKLGADVTVTGDGRTMVKATLNQMAKLNGYANAQQAVEKGFNFYGSKLFKGKNTNEYMQQLLEEGLVKKELSKRLTGNKDIDAYVNNQFLNASDLSTFKPAFGTWDPEIFDEKGNILPGVTLDLSGTRSAHMNFHGNTTYFEAPVKVKTKDGTKEKMAYVLPKTGSQAFIQRALNFATDITEGKVDVLQKQTNDVAKTYSFNNRFKNTLSPQTFESTEVGKGGSIPLMNISDIIPGVNVVVKKEYPSWKDASGVVHYGEDPVMYVYLNKNKAIDPETGKVFYSTNTDAIKAFLDETIEK